MQSKSLLILGYLTRFTDWLFNHEKTKCKCSTRHIWERYQFNHSKNSNSGCGLRCVQDVTWPSVNAFGCSGHIQYINFISPKWNYVSILKFGSLALHRWASNHGWNNIDGTTTWNSNTNCHIQWISGKNGWEYQDILGVKREVSSLSSDFNNKSMGYISWFYQPPCTYCTSDWILIVHLSSTISMIWGIVDIVS